jgi:hypothetical protein
MAEEPETCKGCAAFVGIPGTTFLCQHSGNVVDGDGSECCEHWVSPVGLAPRETFVDKLEARIEQLEEELDAEKRASSDLSMSLSSRLNQIESLSGENLLLGEKLKKASSALVNAQDAHAKSLAEWNARKREMSAELRKLRAALEESEKRGQVTRHDHYLAAALTGLLANPHHDSLEPYEWASDACNIADAAVKRAEKREAVRNVCDRREES